MQVIIVVAITSILVGIMGVMLHSLVWAHRSFESRRLGQSAIQRLATQFRDDVHNAENVKVEDGLTIQNDGQLTRYSTDGETIRRVRFVAGQPVQREQWVIEKLDELRFEIQQGDVPIVSFTAVKKRGIDLHVDAAQGITATEGSEDASQ